MFRQDLNFNLPQELIAQRPIHPRDHSRLLVFKRESQEITDDHFYNLDKYLHSGDVVVLNNSKVIPARLIDDQNKEIFLIRELKDHSWRCLTKYKGQFLVRFKGSSLVGRIYCSSVARTKKYRSSRLETSNSKIIKFNFRGRELWKELARIGEVPTPPYISSHKKFLIMKKDFYQTIFAKEKGSVAAPTAGFHFTQKLVDKLKKRGVEFVFITLHVGLGTFAPIREERVENHRMHAEYFVLSKKTAKILNQAKKEGRRIVAVGTTATRVLETCAITPPSPINPRLPNFYLLKPQSGKTKIFIQPGYKFKFIDALITNFHFPHSTPLLLTGAFIDEKKGVKILLSIYQKAIKKKYRFYSFGDAMLIL